MAGRGVCHKQARAQGSGKSAALVGVHVHVGGAARFIDEGGRVGFRVHQLESLGCDGHGIAHRAAQEVAVPLILAAPRRDSGP